MKRLQIATDAAGVALWSWNIDANEIALDERAHALWGVPRNRPVTFQDLSPRGQATMWRRRAIMFGVFLGVTERKQAEETRELLAGEMSYRIKTCLPSPRP